MPGLELGLGLGLGLVSRAEDENKSSTNKKKKKIKSKSKRKKPDQRPTRSCETKRKQGRKRDLEEIAGVARCSVGSEPESVLSLAGLECTGGPGPDPDLAKREHLSSFSLLDILTPQPYFDSPHSLPSKGLTELEEGLVHIKEERERGEEGDPAKHAFTQALRECQNRRLRSEAQPLPASKSGTRHHHWPASVDGQGADVAALSPRFLTTTVTSERGAGMSKSSTASSRSRSGTFPSPGTPNYHRPGLTTGTYQKGWSSERVPLNNNRRYSGGGVVLPFNNGRKLPSKWEDAEKWILSPVSGDAAGGRLSAPAPHHRRPKSKSGPLGHPMGINGGYSMASPVVSSGNLVGGSPFLAGVLIPEHGASSNGGEGERSYSASKDPPYILRSASVNCWVDTLMEASASLPASHDDTRDGEKVQITREAVRRITSAILTKDVATQMSPEGSTPSSPKDRLSFSYSPRPTPGRIEQDLENHLSRPEVRDVQIDNQVTVTRWSKKHVTRSSDKRSSNIIEWRKKTVEAKGSSWEERERAKCASKCNREEAKITAWENLQKAKAEAAIRKLERKLEKKRSSSLDKILSKLRNAQKKAQDMRNAVSADRDHRAVHSRKDKKAPVFSRSGGKISSFGGCFTCHMFK